MQKEMKTKAIKILEQKMEGLDEATIRHQALRSAKDFKTSWMALGQTLFSVWKDKLFKEWGYEEFESYVSREIGIRKQTAQKLLRSYSFLEKKEPRYLEKSQGEDTAPAAVPTYEAVDVLRRASNNKNMDGTDYARIKKYVLDDGGDAKDAQKRVGDILKEKDDTDPEEAWQKKRVQVVQRFLNMLKALKKELKAEKILPQDVIKETEKLISRIEEEL
ncbi:MAG: hypothetical protein P9L88_02180 [Candidatus Tantalella remota]|nr:hypothetical protein [Candidatus Tantalella remota]